MNFIKSLLTGGDGLISSKRVNAFALIISGIVYAFTKDKPDPLVLSELICGGLALLGISALTKT